MKTLILLFLFVGMSLTSSSQDVMLYKAGQGGEELVNDNLRFKASTNVRIPILFHFVNIESHPNFANPLGMFDLFCELNLLFASTGIEFFPYKEGIRSVDGVWPSFITNQTREVMNMARVDSTLNIFVGELCYDSNSPSLLGAFYDRPHDYIVLDHRLLNEDVITLAHELGHFFSLKNTFWGWEPFPISLLSDTIFVENLDFAPAEPELVDGSNCNTAGDGICDTPPDYGQTQLYFDNCTSDLIFVDANGDILDPDGSLIMSGSHNACKDKFSPMQGEVMLSSAMDESRAYLFLTEVDTNQVVADPVVAVYPQDGEEVVIGVIQFEWSEVANAEYYVFVLSQYSNLTDYGNEFHIVTDTFVSINFDPQVDVPHYWTVVPYTNTTSCVVDPPVFQFSSQPTVDTEDITIAEKSLAYRKVGNTYVFSKEQRELLNAVVLDFCGNKVSSPTYQRDNSVSFSLDQMPAGIYVMSAVIDRKPSKITFYHY